ncbi:hypothetical protein O3799_08095 [Fusobacterium periodonticum]|uniref:hypothetical protein n=1 Tax=Fusobacterium periodonticum TaxID=860 RepID=UPI00352BD8D6
MSNKLVKAEDNFYEEDEISIYEILNIFLKNIKIFIIVTIIGLIATCLYVGKKIIFDKNNISKLNYTLNYQELESYLAGRVFYPQESPSEILLEDEYLEKLFENSELKELYEKNVKENREDINTKRIFLLGNGENDEKAILKNVSRGENKPNSYTVTLKINKKDDSNRQVSISIMRAYLEVLKEYYDETIFKYIQNREKYVEGRLPELKKLLGENAVVGESGLVNQSSMTENNFLKYIYPIKVSNIDTYYSEYVKLENENQAIVALSTLGLNDVNKFIKYDTSIIFEKEKSGNMNKLVIGLFLSVCLGILATYIKNFIEGYKKNQANN